MLTLGIEEDFIFLDPATVSTISLASAARRRPPDAS